jgi:hypothetical protein
MPGKRDETKPATPGHLLPWRRPHCAAPHDHRPPHFPSRRRVTATAGRSGRPSRRPTEETR